MVDIHKETFVTLQQSHNYTLYTQILYIKSFVCLHVFLLDSYTARFTTNGLPERSENNWIYTYLTDVRRLLL